MVSGMKKRDERRLAENEVIFKQINKDAREFLHDLGVDNLLLTPFLCECSNIECRQRIELASADYERIHRNPQRFVVVKGHEVPAIEHIVEHHDTYNVVEKLTELPTPEEAERRLKELK